MNASNRIRVVVDDREKNQDLLNLLDAHESIETERFRLEVCDFSIESQVLVERKTVADFASSLVQGRLFCQAYRLANQKVPRFLILEGVSAEGVGVSQQAIRGALIALAVKYGIPSLQVASPKETVDVLLYIGRQVHTQDTPKASPNGYKPKTKKYGQRKLLQCIPEVGKKRADLLISHFGSIREMVNASPEELNAVEGVGKKAAESVIRWVEEDSVPYDATQQANRERTIATSCRDIPPSTIMSWVAQDEEEMQVFRCSQ